MRNPALIIERSKSNNELRTWRDGRAGIPALEEKGHATRACGCQEASSGNNYENRFFTVICLPRKHIPISTSEAGFADAQDSLSSATTRYTNPSITFFGNISKINTTIPKMLSRQPLSNMQRENLKPYKPYGAEVNMNERKEIQRTVIVNVKRKEAFEFFKNMHIMEDKEDSNEEPKAGEWKRFYSMQEQRMSTDIKLYGFLQPKGIESILQDSVHVTPFYGPFRCSYCNVGVRSYGIQDLVRHLATCHTRLKSSTFTCPTCPSIVMTNWQSFEKHFCKYHAGSTPLIVVLMEANVHTRISWGLALLSLITTVDYLDAQFQETPAEPMRHAGPFGGFCPSHERPRELMRAIQRWQDAILPEDLQWPKENKQVRAPPKGMGSKPQSTVNSTCPSRSGSPTFESITGAAEKLRKGWLSDRQASSDGFAVPATCAKAAKRAAESTDTTIQTQHAAAGSTNTASLSLTGLRELEHDEFMTECSNVIGDVPGNSSRKDDEILLDREEPEDDDHVEGVDREDSADDGDEMETF